MGWNVYEALDTERNDEVLGRGLLAVNDETGEVKVSDGTTAFEDLPTLALVDPANQHAHIVDPSGGGTVDAQARTAIGLILDTLENNGLVATS